MKSVEVAKLVREHFPQLVVVARARNVQHVFELRKLGVELIERETFESALLSGAVVVLGLFGDGDMPDPICTSFDSQSGNGAEPSPRLRQFTESWGDHGVAGSICAPSYDQFFEQAVAVIDTTCEEFQPPAG